MKKLTPVDFQVKTVPVEIIGKYNMQKQQFEEDICRWGTTQQTRMGTTFNGLANLDSNFDSYTD